MGLFLNDRLGPVKMVQLKAVLRRVKKNHPSKPLIEQEFNRRSAGLWGEREVDKKLKRINQEQYYIICDLRLPNGDGTFFQVDTLVLSTRFSLIIEAKNIAGTLYFDLETHQFYRVKEDGKRESFLDPVSQARLHVQQLRQWLLRHKFPLTINEFLVALTNPHSIFSISPAGHPLAKKICAIAGLTWEIDNLAEQYQKEMITDKEVRKISKALLKAHTPLQPSEILQQYSIFTSELQSGVHCPDCEFLPLIYQVGKWYCTKCKNHFKDAHVDALDDYFLLFGSAIKNSEFRKFVHLDSRHVATKLLKKMKLLVLGTKKGCVYDRKR
jgi:ribosomal protein L37AE/L43A